MEEPELVIENREKLMISPTNSNPHLRTAHFLNPTHAATDTQIPRNPLLRLSSLSSTFEPEKCHLNVAFNGWRDPSKKWKSWVGHMEVMYGSVWKRAGIYEAIMSTISSVQRDEDLIIGLAEKWCPETNTFIFPWAEATITLEDMMILGGYSVLGSPAFLCFLESQKLEEIEKKLKEAKTELGRGPARKATRTGWMSMFMLSGSEIEHEAFLSVWLERYVFHDSENTLKARVFPMAIRLAKGEAVALAPAVLARIYRDLGLLKGTILSATEVEASEDYAEVLAVTLWSPMHLVQLWAWERFPAFRPKPNFINNGEPRSALWNNVNGRKIGNVRLAFDSAAETFYWRPYAAGLYSSNLPKFYKEKEEWLCLEYNQELLSFALCLRVSELVGLDCVEQYLPHRVARQFGLDQDIPCDIARSNEFPELVWINYIRPFGHTKLFVPSKFFEPGVTVQYLEWWKQTEVGSHDMLKEAINAPVRKKRSFRKRSKCGSKKGKNWTHDLPRPSPSCHMGNIEDWCEDIKRKIDVVTGSCELGKSHMSNILDSCQDIKPSFEELTRSWEMKKGADNKLFGDFMCLAGKTQNLANAKANTGALKEMNSLEKPVQNNGHINTVTGSSVSALEEKTDFEGEVPNCNTHMSRIEVGEKRSANTFEISAMELEARIVILEKVVADLKAKKFGNRCGRNWC